jgi:hypothetical protein
MAPSEVIITVFFLTWGWGSPPPPVLYHLNPDAKAIMKGDLHLPKRQSKGPRGFLTVKKAGKGHDQSHQSASRLSCIVALGLWELRERKVVKIKQKNNRRDATHTTRVCLHAFLLH